MGKGSGKGSGVASATIPVDRFEAPRKGPYRANNFSAGAAMLDSDVMQYLADNLMSYHGTGAGIQEMSHRDPDGDCIKVIRRAQNNLKNLLSIPDNYKILFFHGGAHLQFSAVPLNLFGKGTNQKADFIIGGNWSEKAMKETAKYGAVHKVTDASTEGYRRYPPMETWNLSPDADFVHVCINETVYGLELFEDVDLDGKVVVADMTSTLLSRPLDVSKYGVIYASAGKNLGPVGVCVAIVREDLIGNELPICPDIMSWKLQADLDNLYNSPCMFAIWAMEAITSDLLEKGGLKWAGERALRRTGQLYEAIDNSQGFYTNDVDPAYRSRTAVVFRIGTGNTRLENLFIKTANEQGFLQLHGHPVAGGLRACVYNGVPDRAVDDLVMFMEDFRQKYLAEL